LTASAGIAGWIEFLLLRSRLNRRIGRTGLPVPFVTVLWLSGAAAAAVALLIRHEAPGLQRFVLATAVLGSFALTYGLLTLALRVPESRAVLSSVSRR
jgi:putative peptidoglycan lipid II flippase